MDLLDEIIISWILKGEKKPGPIDILTIKYFLKT